MLGLVGILGVDHEHSAQRRASLHGAVDLVEQRAHRDDEDRARVTHLVSDLAARVDRVERRDDRANGGGAVEGEEVGEVEGTDVGELEGDVEGDVDGELEGEVDGDVVGTVEGDSDTKF